VPAPDRHAIQAERRMAYWLRASARCRVVLCGGAAGVLATFGNSPPEYRRDPKVFGISTYLNSVLAGHLRTAAQPVPLPSSHCSGSIWKSDRLPSDEPWSIGVSYQHRAGPAPQRIPCYRSSPPSVPFSRGCTSETMPS
jgi:hypothetical protein